MGAVDTSARADEEIIFVTCRGQCNRGAIYVPEIGPMGDEFCMTVEQARATGVHWVYDEKAGVCGGFVCPSCTEHMGAEHG